MHAILTPVGSAGDVNPFVVVGGELRRRGHRVTLIAPDVFAPVASAAGFGFVSDATAEEYDRAANNPDLWHPRRGAAIVFGMIASQLRRAYAAIEQVYHPNECVLVGHSLSFFTRVFEEKHHAPAVTMHLSPSVFRSDFKQSALPSGQDISRWPRWAKRILWWGVDRLAVDPLIAPAMNTWRAELGLPPVSRILKSWFHSSDRVLGLFPDWFGDPQRDWPVQLRLTGFVLSDESCAPSEAPDAERSELEAFLKRGDPPIVFTPGTANRHATEFLRTSIDATAQIERRALLITGHRDQVPESLPSHVHHVGYASFATVFPRAAAVVHHGGIGTSAQALAAGVPQLVMPMGFDQPDNAARLARLGVSETVPPARFTVSLVASALSRLLSSAQVAASCRCWGQRVDSSNALRQACDLIEEQYVLQARRSI